MKKQLFLFLTCIINNGSTQTVHKYVRKENIRGLILYVCNTIG